MSRAGYMLRRWAARYRLQKPFQTLNTTLLGPNIIGFPRRARHRILIYYYPNDICWSLIYPYFYYADAFADNVGAHIRALPVDQFLSKQKGPEADIVIVQPWFTESVNSLSECFHAYHIQNPDVKLIFLDSYAHTDLRLGQAVSPYIDLYLRKALFSNRDEFFRNFAGDTNLTEYYSSLYGLPAASVKRNVPIELLAKLDLVPNFLTAPYLMDGFLNSRLDFSNRPIDLHSRIATYGAPWYEAMRRHADAVVKSIPNIQLTPNNRISQHEFLKEMRQSKLCWSPFGYGELCWRDLEAFMTGAVLIKPSMEHLDTFPEIYRAGETYLPVKWDFSDLEDVVRKALAEPVRCRRMAQTAFDTCKNYLVKQRFVEDGIRHLQLH